MRDREVHATHRMVSELQAEVFLGGERSGKHQETTRCFVETLHDAKGRTTSQVITFGEYFAHDGIEGWFAIIGSFVAERDGGDACGFPHDNDGSIDVFDEFVVYFSGANRFCGGCAWMTRDDGAG
jgi:hypothetical protein